MKSEVSGFGKDMKTAAGAMVGMALAILLLAGLAGKAHALKTNELELGNDGLYDGAVAIQRDPVGRMLFRDTQVTSPTSLWVLQGKALSHATLSGLGEDDHPHYLSGERHAAAHTAAANAALPIPADPAGHVTLGDHVSDADLHLRRGADERITGAWTFAGTVEAAGARLRLSQNGATGDAWILFEDGVEDAMLGWSASARAFDFNRPVRGNAAEWSAVTASQLRADERISGRDALGSPAAILDGFASIEGIAPADLLARGRDETLAGDWTFQGNVKIEGMLEAEVSGPGDCEKKKGRVLSVAISGGDYTSVQAAINAASSGDVVLVYPGTYNEQITGKSGVTVRGVSRDACIIRYDVQFGSPYGPQHSAISWGGSGIFALENLTAQNLSSPPISPGGTATVLYAYNAAILRVRDCNITGSDNDTVSGWGTSQTHIERCRIETLNSQPDQYYFGDTSMLSVTNSEIICTSYVFYSQNTPTIYAHNNIVRCPTDRWPGTVVPGTYYLSANKMVLVDFSPPQAYERVLGDSMVDGKFTVTSTGTFYGETIFGYSAPGNISFLSRVGGNMVKTLRILGSAIHGTPIKLEWSGDGSNWDTNLYRSSASTLKTDGTFEAETVGAVKTLWKDWAAAAAAGAGDRKSVV